MSLEYVNIRRFLYNLAKWIKVTYSMICSSLFPVIPLTVKPIVRLRTTLQYCHAMLVFGLAEQVAGSNFNLLPRGLRLSRWKWKAMFQVSVTILWRQVRQFLCTKPNYRFHVITSASEESGSCSQMYPRRPNQDLAQGCSVGDFPKHRFTWTAALARNFPKRISWWFWLLQASAPESQGKWLTIASE